MKKFFAKVKDWFIAHKPTKRRLIQVYAALLYNAQLKGFFTGKIYTGATKQACLPGLNCYSCPGAVGACPLGALQDSLAQSGTRAPAYIFGILILFGLLLGRIVCGFLCPVGLFQELLYKIRTPKLRKNRFTRVLSYFKYVLLVIVIAIPLIYAGIPSFCKYICPAGTLEGAVGLLSNVGNADFFGMLDYLFTWKFCVLVVLVVLSVFIYRLFCRFICPLGAIYSLFCRISLLGVKLDKDKCIDCGLCVQGCKMDIKHVGDHECIQCGECISVCPVQAISWKGSQIFVKNTTPLNQPAAPEGEKIALLEIAKSNATVAVVKSEEEAKADVAEVAVTESEPVAETAEDAPPTEAAPDAEDAPPEEVATEGKKKGEGWQKVKAAFKKPRFIVEFVAWVLATVLLITALICYNLPEKKLDTVPAFTLATYKSAASDGGEKYSSGDKKVKVVYFWRTDLEESVEKMAQMNEFATDIEGYADVVAVHSYYKDGRDVQAFIDEKGWNAYNIIFAQDDSDTNLYAKFGGDISVPKPITAVLSPQNFISKQLNELPDGEELTKAVIAAQGNTVYAVGDTCPLFVLDCYNNAGGAQKFSVKDCRGKVTVINYWYTDCDPCKEELPEFEEVYRSYNGEINMVAVHSSSYMPVGGASGVQSWIDNNVDRTGMPWKDYTMSFAQDTDAPNTYAMLGGKRAYPITVVLDANGVITKVNQGKMAKESLIAAIEAAKV
ncbi:MAG: 4Fe-4S binding protein [Clostridia bacterium]|nr:4Fe-4S binding protein [Clostridia bacterium]